MHGHKEQMVIVTKSITAILAEREKFYKELRNWVKELELLRSLVISLNPVSAQRMSLPNPIVVPARTESTGRDGEPIGTKKGPTIHARDAG